MPLDKVNIRGLCLSGWNTREFYCLPLANLYFLKFLTGTHTHFVIGGEARLLITLRGVLALPQLSQEPPALGALPGKPPCFPGDVWAAVTKLHVANWLSCQADEAGPPDQPKGLHKGSSPPMGGPGPPLARGSPAP